MTTTVPVLPDAEAVVISWLRAHTGLTAVIVAANIATQVNNAAWPVLTIARVGGIPPVPVRVDRAVIDVNVWGLTKAGASLGIRTACAAMLEMPGYTTTAAVVTGVTYILGPRWLPDDSREPVVPRYMASLAVTIRPNT